MDQYAQKSTKLSPFACTVIYGVIVIIAAQIRIPLFTEGFVVSAGVILFSLLMLLLNEFATLPVVFISAAGVMVTRAFAQAGAIVGPEEIWITGMPEFAFYIVYGILIYILFRYLNVEGRYPAIFIVLVIPDFIANFIEMYIRSGAVQEYSDVIIPLLVVAVIRSLIILAIYALIIRYGFPVTKIPGGTGYAREFDGTDNDGESGDIIMASAAQDAAVLYKKLEHAQADEELLEQAKKLVDTIENAVRK